MALAVPKVTVVQVPARGAGGRPHLLLEWEGGTLGDMVADAAVAIVLQARYRPRKMPLILKQFHTDPWGVQLA